MNKITHCAVDAERNQHEEEENGPYRTVGHCRDGLRVYDEDQTRSTVARHFRYVPIRQL